MKNFRIFGKLNSEKSEKNLKPHQPKNLETTPTNHTISNKIIVTRNVGLKTEVKK